MTNEIAICVAEEWHRDGRGLWAMRRCISHQGHDSSHTFEPWRYDVDPPQSRSQTKAERDRKALLSAAQTVLDAAESERWIYYEGTNESRLKVLQDAVDKVGK